METRLSIVIPNYNHGQFLEACIESQCTRELEPEIVVIDDCSTDDSVQIVERLRARHATLRLIRLKERGGVVNAMNLGLSVTNGEFVLFRAADDLSVSDALLEAMTMLDRNPKAGLSCGDIGYFLSDPSKAVVEPLHLSAHSGYVSPIDLEGLLGQSPIYSHTALFRRSALEAFGPFRIDHQYYSDWYLTTVIAAQYGVCYLARCVAFARLSPTSFSNAGSRQEANRMEVCESMIRDLELLPPLLRDAVYRTRGLEFFGLKPKTSIAIPNSPHDRWRRAGMGAVIRSKLCRFARDCSAERYENRIVIFGAGGHTRMLLDLWEESSLPWPSQIWVSRSEDAGTRLSGIPVIGFNEVSSNYQPDIIVISSKSYESAMLAKAVQRFPNTVILTFWGSEDRNIG